MNPPQTTMTWPNLPPNTTSTFSVYAIESGRICVAALNTGNVDYVADAMATVVK